MSRKVFEIDTNDGGKFPLDLATTPTVGELKTLLAAKDRSDRSTLIVRLGPRILPDDFHLSEADLVVGDMSWDYVSSLPPRHVTFKSPDGRFVKTRYSKRTTMSKAIQVICTVLKLKNSDAFIVSLNGKKIARTTLLWSLPLSEPSILKIEDVPKLLKISYKRPDGHKQVASTRYRGIVDVETVLSKIAPVFQLQNAKTGLFLNDTQLADDSLLGDVVIPEDGLEVRVITSAIPDGSPEASLDAIRHQVEIRTPKKLVKARFKESATVGEAKVKIAKVLDLDADQLLFSKKPDDGELLKDLDPKEGELRVHVFQPVKIRFPNGKTVLGRFSELATVKSTKEAIGKRLSIEARNIRFDLENSDDEKKLKDIELPEGGIIRVRSNVVTIEEEEEEEEAEYADDGSGGEDDDEKIVKAPITKDDVSQVKLEFPDGFVAKTVFRAKATVEKAREAAARQLGVKPANVVLVYNDDNLPDHLLIAQLHIPRNRKIIVRVTK